MCTAAQIRAAKPPRTVQHTRCTSAFGNGVVAQSNGQRDTQPKPRVSTGHTGKGTEIAAKKRCHWEHCGVKSQDRWMFESRNHRNGWPPKEEWLPPKEEWLAPQRGMVGPPKRNGWPPKEAPNPHERKRETSQLTSRHDWSHQSAAEMDACALGPRKAQSQCKACACRLHLRLLVCNRGHICQPTRGMQKHETINISGIFLLIAEFKFLNWQSACPCQLKLAGTKFEVLSVGGLIVTNLNFGKHHDHDLWDQCVPDSYI